jgi:hypothetical protein
MFINEIIINVKSAFAALAHVSSISPPTHTSTLVYRSNIAPSPQSYPSILMTATWLPKNVFSNTLVCKRRELFCLLTRRLATTFRSVPFLFITTCDCTQIPYILRPTSLMGISKSTLNKNKMPQYGYWGIC